MKREIIILFFIVLLGSFASAEIIFNEQPKSIYNLGDSIFTPVTIKTLTDISGGSFQMDLICNGTAINFYKNGVKLAAGEEKRMESSLVLIRNIIGNERGTCKIKAILNGVFSLSDNFKISELLNIEAKLDKTELDAGESILVTGTAIREDGENSDGFIEIRIFSNNAGEEIIQEGTVNQGIFSTNISLPEKLKAGIYSVEVKAYEEDSDGIITNKGVKEYNIRVRQVPTSLEIVFENKEIIPGTPLKIKTILHDQTGEQINSTVFITIKDSADKILEQKEINTGDFFEYSIKSNEPPAEWKVFAVSNKLTAEDKFRIKELEKVKIEVLNKTILITNTGNVPYNKTLLVKVEETPLNVQVTLKVGESKKYILSAPNGEYPVKVIADNENEISKIISLTGDIIGIKEASQISFTSIFWVVLVLILGVTGFTFFRKAYKKQFFGKIFSRKEKGEKKMPVLGRLGEAGNKAELSLSIKGEKQDAMVICLKIKNLREAKSGRGSASETIQKIVERAEENKAVFYENQDYLFFILAPIKTKTFKNEKSALETAESIQRILKEHNKMFNQKIDFGISLNYGTIVAKVEDGTFKFMSMGSLMTISKKIASLSDEEILLSEKMNDALRLHTKTEKNVREGIPVFIIREIKKENEDARKFIDKFMNRQRKE